MASRAHEENVAVISCRYVMRITYRRSDGSRFSADYLPDSAPLEERTYGMLQTKLETLQQRFVALDTAIACVLDADEQNAVNDKYRRLLGEITGDAGEEGDNGQPQT